MNALKFYVWLNWFRLIYTIEMIVQEFKNPCNPGTFLIWYRYNYLDVVYGCEYCHGVTYLNVPNRLVIKWEKDWEEINS